MKNWWYYHKWYVISGIILFFISFNLLSNAFGWFKKTPDFQIAYIGEFPLPDDTVKALEKAFSSLADDYNHDGQIIVHVNQYTTGSLNDNNADNLEYRQASELQLIADIDHCESYFFLMETPEIIQDTYQILALPDGNCPAPSDFSVTDKTIVWSDIDVFQNLNLGSYKTTLLGNETSGENSELLAPLYLGRRCFYTSPKPENADDCAILWNKLFTPGTN